ncbi:MAG TPA: H-X9-DG-CTERM domain-containing protein [Tepidisphaeraceae bacterium]|nr:H-X9-DG-CTERM domain-containing protein [Tepidisphaeraceae bacterium]
MVIVAVNLTGPNFDDRLATIHRGGANVLFGDGHVSWYLRDQLCTKYPPDPSDAAKQRLWNADNEPTQKW